MNKLYRRLLAFILAILLFVTMAGTALAATLTITTYEQEKTNWCWAAISVCIVNYLGWSTTQTMHSIMAVGNSYNNDTRTIAQCYGDYRTIYGLTGTTYVESILSIADVQYQINTRGKPIHARVRWTSDSGHAIAISGIELSGIYVMQVIDPYSNTKTWLPYSASISIPAGSGTWSHSIYNF